MHLSSFAIKAFVYFKRKFYRRRIIDDLESTLLAKIAAFLFTMGLCILINALLDCGDSSFKIDGECHLRGSLRNFIDRFG